MKKAFFFDIDGTLVACGEGVESIPQNVRDALDALKRKGHLVFLATGRCPCFILPGVIDYDFDGIVTCNGTYVEYHNEPVYKKSVNVDIVKKVHEFCKEHDFSYYFESRDEIYVLNKEHPVYKEFVKVWGMNEDVVFDDKDLSCTESYIGMIVANKVEDYQLIIDELSEYFFVQKHNHGHSFDLTIKDESKAKGIQKVCEYLGIKQEDVVAFGDGNNDVEMLEYAGLGIAMGNAAVNAKNAADYITDHVMDNGLINALKHFNFI